ncbi:hypothetical protein [Paenarthrobacter aurescens]|jgi:hypothetical protein|uniref:Uncharacterized protein n=1 Tax=Paenarthrobacter aurescens (strain TC1) TaxID=290340 RepID=A1RD29_PAEAT|nr:hypothetical protein [Paenarthrobacter aurescens]ABM10505.1 hypothetical protein AAur_pTC10272 [Paenarthrobacter aurescens TC1]
MAEMIWNEGEHVEALDLAGTRISGTVEQVAPEIGAAWIREDGLGERRLVISDDVVASD